MGENWVVLPILAFLFLLTLSSFFISSILAFPMKRKQTKPSAKKKKILRIPLALSPVKAGFPSPAEDFFDGNLDLNEHLIEHPAATFFVKVDGDSMKNAGIFSGDMLVVDRSVVPVDRKIVIAVVDGELTVKRLRKKGKRLLLVAENPDFEPIEVSGEQELMIWGVVTSVVRKI